MQNTDQLPDGGRLAHRLVMQQHLLHTHKRHIRVCSSQTLQHHCVCTHWEALCDGDLDVEQKDSGSEPSAHSDGLLGFTEHAAHAGKR